MYGNHRVVVVTPAGRRRYLELLAHYVGRAMRGVVDEWQLWANTPDRADLDYLESLARQDGIRLIHEGQPLEKEFNIHRFFSHAAEPDTIYVRLDDDIVYLAPDFFTQLLATRDDDRDSFLVSAAVVNNVLCDWLRQRAGLITRQTRITYACMCPTGWASALWAERLHRTFLPCARDKVPSLFNTPDWLLLDAERFSINAIAWHGHDMAAIIARGGVGSNEEAWLTQTWPLTTNRVNRICGAAICAHFAFGPQRAYLDTTDILSRYKELIA